MSAKKFDKLREQLQARPDGAQALDRARNRLDAEVAAYEAGLAQIRRAHGLTQEQLARQLGVTQGEVSRMERRADLFLSTLQSYIEAMGGDLELVGVFDGERVRLAIGEVLQAEGTNDEAGAEIAPAELAWDINASLEYSGDVHDTVMNTVRAQILTYIWARGDAVAISRGQYSDVVDVSFLIEADNESEARTRAIAALQRAVRKAPVRPTSNLSVELAATMR